MLTAINTILERAVTAVRPTGQPAVTTSPPRATTTVRPASATGKCERNGGGAWDWETAGGAPQRPTARGDGEYLKNYIRRPDRPFAMLYETHVSNVMERNYPLFLMA